MQKKYLTNFEVNTFFFFLLRSCLLGLAIQPIMRVAKQDCWISIIIGAILGLIPVLGYLYIEKKDIKIKNVLFNSFIKIINVVFIIFVLFITSILFYHFINLIKIQYLSDTSTIIIGLCFLGVLFYLLMKGINVIGKVSVIFYLIALGFFIVSFTNLAFKFDVNYLKPILSNGLVPVIKGALIYFGFNLLSILLITVYPKDRINNDRKKDKSIIISYFITQVILLILTLFIIGIFGIDLSLLQPYPELTILKSIAIIGVFERLEGLLGVEWIFSLFMALVLLIYFIYYKLHTLFNFKKKVNNVLIILILFLVFFISRIIY